MTDLQSLFFYLLAFALATLFIYFGNSKRYTKGLSVFFVLIGLLIPTILCGIRYGVGTDFSDYERIYNYAVNNNHADFNTIFKDRSIEPSFYILSNISNTITQDSSLLFAIYGFMSVTFFYLSAKYFSKKWVWLSFFAFLCIYFPIGLSGIRQFVAMSIFLFSIRYIINKKLTRYIIAILAASLFHQTSIILLPVYLLGRYFLNNHTGWYRLLPVIFLGAVLLLTPAINIILALPLFSRYEYMSDLERDSVYIGGTFFVQLMMLIFLAFFFTRLYAKDKTYRILFPVFLTGVLLYGIGFRFMNGWRLSLYMLPIASLLIPNIAEHVSGRAKKYVPVAVIAFAVVYFIAIYYISGNFGIFPFNFIRGANE